jgi:glucose-6-phosphate isomerase
MVDPTRTAAWEALRAHHDEVADLQMRDLFHEDPDRASRFSLTLGDLLFDFSKNRITDQTISLLTQLCDECGVRDWITRMFSGDPINETEERAVLHTALRNRDDRTVVVDGVEVMPEVRRVLSQMRAFATSVREGAWVGYTGRTITDVVNIGISGDGDRGVAAVLEARAARTLRIERRWDPLERGASAGAA